MERSSPRTTDDPLEPSFPVRVTSTMCSWSGHAVMLIAESRGKCTNWRGIPALLIVSPRWTSTFRMPEAEERVPDAEVQRAPYCKKFTFEHGSAPRVRKSSGLV